MPPFRRRFRALFFAALFAGFAEMRRLSMPPDACRMRSCCHFFDVFFFFFFADDDFSSRHYLRFVSLLFRLLRFAAAAEMPAFASPFAGHDYCGGWITMQLSSPLSHCFLLPAVYAFNELREMMSLRRSFSLAIEATLYAIDAAANTRTSPCSSNI